MSGAGIASRLLLGLVAAVSSAAQAGEDDAARLATARGCTICHRPSLSPDAPSALAPTWREIADRYRGKPDAVDRLGGVVLAGSTWRPSERHWAGKAILGGMPPNTDIDLQPAEARRLVRWILAH